MNHWSSMLVWKLPPRNHKCHDHPRVGSGWFCCSYLQIIWIIWTELPLGPARQYSIFVRDPQFLIILIDQPVASSKSTLTNFLQMFGIIRINWPIVTTTIQYDNFCKWSEKTGPACWKEDHPVYTTFCQFSFSWSGWNGLPQRRHSVLQLFLQIIWLLVSGGTRALASARDFL